ncbi:hypothetical protein D3C87_1789090 [compost metagenome]
MPWYLYTPVTIPPDVCNPNNYTLVGSIPPNCPNPNNFLCAIQANDNLGKPIITFALICEIANAVNNRTETTNVLLRPNP